MHAVAPAQSLSRTTPLRRVSSRAAGARAETRAARPRRSLARRAARSARARDRRGAEGGAEGCGTRRRPSAPPWARSSRAQTPTLRFSPPTPQSPWIPLRGSLLCAPTTMQTTSSAAVARCAPTTRTACLRTRTRPRVWLYRAPSSLTFPCCLPQVCGVLGLAACVGARIHTANSDVADTSVRRRSGAPLSPRPRP
jgi:hypothetical protein